MEIWDKGKLPRLLGVDTVGPTLEIPIQNEEHISEKHFKTMTIHAVHSNYTISLYKYGHKSKLTTVILAYNTSQLEHLRKLGYGA